MMRRRTLLAASGMLAGRRAWAQPTGVDVLLALAVDVSGSVTDDEAILQRDGYRRAMTDPTVWRDNLNRKERQSGLESAVAAKR